MKLVPVYPDEIAISMQTHTTPFTPGDTRFEPTVRQFYGIHLTKVERTSGQGKLHVYGKVAADETRVFRVTVGTEGYVKETQGDAIGNHVMKDQHLALIYSPDFLSVAGGYLSANERSPNGNTRDNVATTQNAASAQARADRLRNLGMSDVQLDEISISRKIPEDIYVVSPTDGFIISRDISPGMRFEKHAELYRIADLSRVWILAEVFGKDTEAFRPGTIARITLPDTGERFLARVSQVLPELDPATRTLKPRLELLNPGFHLRPGMFVDIEVPVTLRGGLSIPSDAILNTGLNKRVFVQSSEGTFAMREVETGSTSGDRIQILRGLQEGELVVSSGAFLVDSESSIHMVSDPLTADRIPRRR